MLILQVGSALGIVDETSSPDLTLVMGIMATLVVVLLVSTVIFAIQARQQQG